MHRSFMPTRRSNCLPALRLMASASAYMLATVTAHAGPPDWSKAGAAPATVLQPMQPMAPMTSMAASAPLKSGSAFAPKPLAAPTSMSPTTPAPTIATTPIMAKPSVMASPSTSALAPKAATNGTNATAPTQGDLFKLADTSIIIVGGKPVTAGSLKAQMDAAFKAKAGSPKLVKAAPRKIDLQMMNVMSSSGTVSIGAKAGAVVLANNKAIALNPKPGFGSKAGALANTDAADSFRKIECTDKGPPNILEVGGKLVANGRVTLTGYCFGDKPGRVEVLGQFAGGKLVPAFSAWTKTSITIDIPTSHGVGDGNVVVTVVSADNKTSNAVQAAFVATRERVEVPDRMWDGGGRFELSATTVLYDSTTRVSAVNPAAAGTLPKSIRINPQCSLDNMDVTSYAGAALSINGFADGPPNEANITIGWQGTCLETDTMHNYNYLFSVGVDTKITSACQVILQPRAWAYCPVGVAP